uniref:Alpha-type protein kinase domain-containing protein n=1 Tax=Phytophthora ramorum TaxID=164328 RepID=H3GBG9_PHYRM
MTTRAPLSMTPPPRRASCGGQQTGEARGGWFYHTVSAATPTEKRKAKLFHQEAGEHETQETEQQFVWSVGSSRSRDSSGTVQFERTREIAGNLQDSILARISTLRALCDEGFISDEEYERRKCAIVDELTFSSLVPASSTQNTVTQRRRMSFRRSEVPHAPNFREMSPELAIKHVFNYATRQWSSKQVCINLDETPFSKGSLRIVYHLQDLSIDNSASLSSGGCYTGSYVAKLAIDPDEDPQTYFRDIELQAHCAHYAQVYNSYTPPKRVEFIPAWVLELPERNGALCAVEAYIPGEYRKHNNNFGSVSDDERNTPQAFSHFTYEASNHELLAVDIQGVGDLYTDPQIHTLNGHDFGKGNLGVLGFQKFLSSHRCNSICRYLKLPAVNPKSRHADSGTLPVQELMNRDRVRPTHFDSRHYYENAPMLQKYVTQCREVSNRLSSASSTSSSKRFRKRRNRQRSGFASFCNALFCGGC